MTEEFVQISRETYDKLSNAYDNIRDEFLGKIENLENGIAKLSFRDRRPVSYINGVCTRHETFDVDKYPKDQQELVIIVNDQILAYQELIERNKGLDKYRQKLEKFKWSKTYRLVKLLYGEL